MVSLLRQVWWVQGGGPRVGTGGRRRKMLSLFLSLGDILGALVPGRGEGVVGAVWRTLGNDQSELLRPARARPRAGEWIRYSYPNIFIFVLFVL